MTKLAKEIPVHLACPACGKTQRVKLKWARNHKSLKCKDCRKAIDLRAPQAKSLIARTAQAVATFERALEVLRAAAKQAGRARKAAKKAKKPAKKKAAKKNTKKMPRKKPAARRRSAKPAQVTLPVLSAGAQQPSP